MGEAHLGYLVSDVALEILFNLSILVLASISAYLCYRTFSDHLVVVGRLPGLQICCLRVVAVAPMYAFLTWLKLTFLPALVVWKTVQDLAEAYAIYCYWVMLIIWCGGQMHVIEHLEEEGETQTCSLCPMLGVAAGKKVYGCPLLSFRSANGRFKFWRIEMTQLIIVKIVISVVEVFLVSIGASAGGMLHFVALISTSVAMHALLETYAALRFRLRNFSAEKKFFCIKILVIFALLQPLLTNVLKTFGLAFPDDQLYGYSSRKWSQRVMGTMAVIQMAAISLLLSYAFSLKILLRDCERDGSVPSSPIRSPRAASTVRSQHQSGDLGIVKGGAKMTWLQMARVWDVLLCRTIDESFIGGS
mmetsp:Transcript_13538/g.34055  ORF Transcript_13538/g.34055 Transcript_13538/m.34055 type:complete len:360 (-) Transcript_13538:142-1221(-)